MKISTRQTWKTFLVFTMMAAIFGLLAENKVLAGHSFPEGIIQQERLQVERMVFLCLESL